MFARLRLRLVALALPAAVAATALAVALAPASAQADALGDLAASFESQLGGGNWFAALGVCFVAGLATCLTPCVYPMVTITVSIFGARSEETSRLRAMALSTAFVAGICTLFTVLGVFAAMSGRTLGQDTIANPWVMLPLSALYAAMAASMFGAFDIDLPMGLKNRLGGAKGAGLTGAFLLGLTSAVVAAPCTGPVIAILMGYVATTRDIAFGASAFFSYALGLGTLYWVVGTFAVSLPKSGRWMLSVKSLFGIAMLVMAVHFALGLVGDPWPAARSLPWLATAIGLAAIGVLLGAIHYSFKADEATRPYERARKTLGVTLTTGGLVALVAWIIAVPEGAHIEWREDISAAKAEAEARGVPMLVDFGADWCQACTELEHGALSDPRVVSEARRFVTLRVDLSAHAETPEKWALRSSYGAGGLPFIVIHDGEGAVTGQVTSPIGADEMLALLRRAR